MKDIKLTTGQDIQKVIDEIAVDMKNKDGLKSVFGVACGGSLSSTYPLYYLLRQEATTIHAENIPANEFCHSTPKTLCEQSIVVLMSRGGDTPETVAAAKVAKEHGAKVITVSIADDVPLSEFADYHFIWAATNADDYVYSNTAIILRIGYEILRAFENYAAYDKAVEAFAKLDSVIRSAIEKVKPRANTWADRYQNHKTIYTMGSDAVVNVAYCTCICHLMEMEWVNSSCIQSGDYFHGPFEITDTHVPFMLFKSSGKGRYLDDRAEKFLKDNSACVEVIDAEDYGIDQLDESVRQYFDSLLLFAVGRVYTETLAVYKQHPFLYRKYMFKFSY